MNCIIGQYILAVNSIVWKKWTLKPSGASKLIKLLLDNDVIAPIKGYGKGKYRFLN